MSYRTPELFPGCKGLAHPQHSEQSHNHIEQRLIELAESGKLSLTDVLNQPMHLADHAGMIMLGHEWVPGRHPTTAAITYTPGRSSERRPKVFDDYKVRLQLINNAAKGDHIKFKVGHERRDVVSSRGGAVLDKQTLLWQDRFHTVECPNGVCEVGINDAWLILRQMGEHCCYAKRRDTQQRRWLVREVVERPEPKKTSKPRARVRAAEATV